MVDLVCRICGSKDFVAGFKGRLTNGCPPACAKCHTVERHRMVHALYNEMRPVIKDMRALHYAPDRSVDPAWFKSYRASIFGTPTSLNMEKTGLPANSFDIILSNHVLEHVGDEAGAFSESFRLVGQTGVVHFCVPTPLFRWETVDWGFADPNINEHFRDYGAEFPLHVANLMKGVHGMAVTGTDPITAQQDMIYFFSFDNKALEKLAFELQRHGRPVVRTS
jgi:SAM-dependent methyltransferase